MCRGMLPVKWVVSKILTEESWLKKKGRVIQAEKVKIVMTFDLKHWQITLEPVMRRDKYIYKGVAEDWTKPYNSIQLVDSN